MNDLCDKAILVSAHPDDEVLWSSSILNRVDEVVICFLGMKSEPDTKRGREKSLGAYPLRNISCFGLDEAGTFYGVDWNNTVLTPYGIKIADRKYPDKTYRENYHRLKGLLQDRLAGYANVFTHNPWGEYGNDEHIQVYRVIRDLQESMQFRLWFPNYVSNKSFRLMLDYMHKSDLEAVSMKTDIGLAETVKKLYTGNRCWTWYADWQWQADEAFLSEKVAAPRTGAFRSAVPLNMIKVWLPPVSKTISLFQRVPLCRTGGRRMLDRITKTIATNLKNL
jgi:LmbE family N-acetylglucosaminyl deacetylase